MPYVDQDRRDEVEWNIAVISETILRLPADKWDGALNYVVSELVGRTMKPKYGWSYHMIHRAYGVFMAAGAEFYRRVAAPYENECIAKNGDIKAYKPACLTPPVAIPKIVHVSPPRDRDDDGEPF